MFPRLAFSCIALFLSAAGATAQTHSSADEPVPDGMVLLLNPSGGRFQVYETDTVSEPLDITVDLSIERMHAHAEWAPRAGICVAGTASKYEACLQLDRSSDTGTELLVNRRLFKDEDGTLASSTPVAGSFKVGSAVTVGIRAKADSVEFRVGDGPWQVQALPFTPRSYKLSCSSALCRFRTH